MAVRNSTNRDALGDDDDDDHCDSAASMEKSGAADDEADNGSAKCTLRERTGCVATPVLVLATAAAGEGEMGSRSSAGDRDDNRRAVAEAAAVDTGKEARADAAAA
jgi:hypothetical protein